MNRYRTPQDAVCPCEADGEVCMCSAQTVDDPTGVDLTPPWEQVDEDSRQAASLPATEAGAGSPAPADRRWSDDVIATCDRMIAEEQVGHDRQRPALLEALRSDRVREAIAAENTDAAETRLMVVKSRVAS